MDRPAETVNQRHDLRVRPDGGERVHAAKAADDGGVRRVKQLLDNAAQRDRQRKAQQEAVDIRALNALPFLLLEHGGKAKVSDLLEQSQVRPDIRFTTWEDFAIMAMVERGMGVGILPDMILRRIPYRLEIRTLKEPYYRSIGLAMKHAAHLTPAARKFIDYLLFREADRS